MNDLSWFLYLADVLPRFANVVGGVTVAMCIVLGFGGSFLTIGKFVEEGFNPPLKTIWGAFAALVVFGLSTNLIPSRETIYLIAGSEAGEAVVTSEGGQEVLNDIQEVIRLQLEKLKNGGEE